MYSPSCLLELAQDNPVSKIKRTLKNAKAGETGAIYIRVALTQYQWTDNLINQTDIWCGESMLVLFA